MTLLAEATKKALVPLDLMLHRLRVGHGIPSALHVVAERLDRRSPSVLPRRELERIRAEASLVKERYAGQRLSLVVSRLPQASPRDLVELPASCREQLTLTSQQVTPAALRATSEWLRDKGLRALRELPIRRILDVLDRASLKWLDPEYAHRSLAIEAIHRYTGFSREMVIHSIDLEMRSSRRLDLWRTLLVELGNPAVLDRPAWTVSGETSRARAFGPDLLTAVFSSNIPALPHLSYMRGLAVKSPVLAKVATHEPIFASLYLDTLIELCPSLKDALAAVWFPGGSVELEREMHAASGHVIAYGSHESLAALAERLPSKTPRLLHSHRMGVGVLERSALELGERWAPRVAYDFCAFDGQACLAPIVYFLEGSLAPAKSFATSVAQAANALGTWLPRRALDANDAAARRLTVERWHTRSVFQPDEVGFIRGPEPGPAWAGLITTGGYRPERLGDRLFHFHCVDSLEQVAASLREYASSLQNVALAGDEQRCQALASELASLGASRATRPGLMPTPSMMWHHDGHACIGSLVRWSDLA